MAATLEDAIQTGLRDVEVIEEVKEVEEVESSSEGEVEVNEALTAREKAMDEIFATREKELEEEIGESFNEVDSSEEVEEVEKVEVAKKELNREKSLAYSDLLVGPIVGYESRGADQFVSAGIGVTFNAPFLNTNEGGKLEASRNLMAQRKVARNNISLLKIKLRKLLKIYHQSLKTYQEMPSLSQITTFHTEAESLFRRGVVSIPMTIESHRQYVDYMDSRFETENDILKAIKEIYLITGKESLIDELFN